MEVGVEREAEAENEVEQIYPSIAQTIPLTTAMIMLAYQHGCAMTMGNRRCVHRLGVTMRRGDGVQDGLEVEV